MWITLKIRFCVENRAIERKWVRINSVHWLIIVKIVLFEQCFALNSIIWIQHTQLSATGVLYTRTQSVEYHSLVLQQNNREIVIWL